MSKKKSRRSRTSQKKKLRAAEKERRKKMALLQQQQRAFEDHNEWLHTLYSNQSARTRSRASVAPPLLKRKHGGGGAMDTFYM